MFHARMFPEDQRYQDAYIKDLHKGRNKTELYDHYFERAEAIVKALPLNAPPQPRPYGQRFWFWFRIATILGIIFLLDRIGRITRRSGFPGLPGLPGSGSSPSYKMSEGGETRFSDVHGIEEVKQELQIIVDFLNTPQKFKEIGAKIPRGTWVRSPDLF